MKIVYWIKVDVWCKYPFQDEIDYRYIEFHTKLKYNHKTKLDFTCNSLVIGEDRFNLVAEKLETRNFKLVSILTHNKKNMPRCKNCKQKFESNIFLMKYCGKDECIKKFVESTKQKEWIVKKSKMKQDLLTVQDYVKIAQTHFNNYIRKRDEGLKCISCDKPPLKKERRTLLQCK